MNNTLNQRTKDPYFLPRIGANFYEDGVFTKRILVLGDSHYCGECDNCGIMSKYNGMDSTCHNFTRNVVSKYLKYRQGKEKREGWMNTFLKFERALVEHKTDASESLKIWESVAFYNYIQTAYILQSRQAYANKDYELSSPYFWQVLNKLKPDVAIIWGHRLWDRLPGENWIDGQTIYASGIEEKYGYYVLKNDKKVLTLRTIHPSGGFAWNAYGEIFKKAFRSRVPE